MAKRSGASLLATGAGALFGATGVAFAAAAAHLAPAHLDPARAAMLDRGVQMQMWHASALLAAGALLRDRDGGLARLAAAAMACGLLAFLAGVYARAVWDVSLGPTAPIGGTALIASWLLLGAASVRLPRGG